MNNSLRTVVAITLKTIETSNGYISPVTNKDNNTQTLVAAELKKNPIPSLPDEYYQFADEVINYFKQLPNDPNYKKIVKGLEGDKYAACSDASKNNEVTNVSFPYVVAMPHYYGKVYQQERSLKVDKTEAVLTKPDSFIGVVGEPDRFFFKIIEVSGYNSEEAGSKFLMIDRNKNLGYFWEHPDLLEGKFKLGDCVVINAIPMKHEQEGQFKTTKFRAVNIIENKGQGSEKIDNSKDLTGKFQNG